MSYLRIIASAYVTRAARTTCVPCGRAMYAFEIHCPYCGHPNSGFSQALFERIAKTTVAEAVLACRSGLAHVAERVARDELEDQALRCCSVCGVLLAEPSRP